jgi:hypothetical protein
MNVVHRHGMLDNLRLEQSFPSNSPSRYIDGETNPKLAA